MQTFLPYQSFTDSARCLDRQRLGKQRLECKQILNALRGKTKGWANHPVTKMWAGYEQALCLYAIAICLEWRMRGYRDSQLSFFAALLGQGPVAMPPFVGDAKFHASHQVRLYNKNPQFYSMFKDAA